MVGSARSTAARAQGVPEDDILTRTHAELDLTDQAATACLHGGERPDVVILAAAKVGGIHANNTYPAEFIRDNLMIQANVIHEPTRRRRPAPAAARLVVHLPQASPPSPWPRTRC